MNRRTALSALTAAALMAALPVARGSEGFEVVRATLAPSADGEALVLSADLSIALPPTLEDAVNKGVTLYFLVEFELRRRRWYWWDDRAAVAAQTHRLSYHALTRQYRLLLNGVPMAFGTLAEALEAMALLRGWRVTPAERVRAETDYEGWLRVRLDTSQLPKPFQIPGIAGRDWSPQSEWKRFAFTPTPRSER